MSVTLVAKIAGCADPLGGPEHPGDTQRPAAHPTAELLAFDR